MNLLSQQRKSIIEGHNKSLFAGTGSQFYPLYSNLTLDHKPIFQHGKHLQRIHNLRH